MAQSLWLGDGTRGLQTAKSPWETPVLERLRLESGAHGWELGWGEACTSSREAGW